MRELPWAGFVAHLLFCFFFGVAGGVWFFGPVVSWRCGVRRWLSWFWVSWSPSPLLFRAAPSFFSLLFLFSRLRPSEVCVGVCGVSCLPVGRCSGLGFAVFGWVVLRCSFGGPGGCRLPCRLAEEFARLLRKWAASRLWAYLCPRPQFLFGGVCQFLPLPSLGWCTHWSAVSVVNLVAAGACVLQGLVPAPWVGWVMYTFGSVALPVGVGSGSTGWAVAPGGFVRPLVREARVFRVPPPRRCRL